MTLPLLISVPHAGLTVPSEAARFCSLEADEIVKDSDEGAAEIYSFDGEAELVTTGIARAIVDLNRAPDDFRPDGVIKERTAFEVPVWKRELPRRLSRALIKRYHRPYHRRLSEAAGRVMAGVDCHTMLEVGPPIGPGPGGPRPVVCLSDGDGSTLPEGWMDRLARCFEEAFGIPPAINDPFKGGYITRAHSREMPWVQVEVVRGPVMPTEDKRQRVLAALRAWARALPTP